MSVMITLNDTCYGVSIVSKSLIRYTQLSYSSKYNTDETAQLNIIKQTMKNTTCIGLCQHTAYNTESLNRPRTKQVNIYLVIKRSMVNILLNYAVLSLQGCSTHIVGLNSEIQNMTYIGGNKQICRHTWL
jgi:hypothetical protein